METAISLISDLVIIWFDMALYSQLTLLKKDDGLHRGVMYGGCLVISILYGIAAYVLGMPYSSASVLCMTIPSFLLFLYLSKYKTSRFLVTFCFVDTVTFVIAALGKIAMILGGMKGAVISLLIMAGLAAAVFWGLRPWFPRYRELMDRVSTGWTPMAISTVFIYILLPFTAAYPAPLITRMEYLVPYLFLCATVLSFYAVFIVLIIQKAKLTQANILLQQQKHWQELAYMDELTHLANSAAYASRTRELESQQAHEKDVALLILDIDDFKHVNDTYGHHKGNEVLKKSAELFLDSFPGKNFEFFRVGGDEFSAIASGLTPQELTEAVSKINRMTPHTDLNCTYSCGWAPVDFSLEKPFEQAFIQADKAMYQMKAQKKHRS